MKTFHLNDGFTLIELVIAVSIFMIILMLLGGLVASSIRFQRQAIDAQNVDFTLRSSLEILSRDIRLAAKDTAGSCVGTARKDFSQPNGATSLQFLNDRSECIKYYLKSGVIHRKFINGADQALTSGNAYVTELNFDVLGDNGNDQQQPRIVIRVAAKPNSNNANPVTVRVQTAVTQRELDVQ